MKVFSESSAFFVDQALKMVIVASNFLQILVFAVVRPLFTLKYTYLFSLPGIQYNISYLEQRILC